LNPRIVRHSLTYWIAYGSMSDWVAGAGLSVSEGSPEVSGLRPPAPATVTAIYLTNIDSRTTTKLGGPSYKSVSPQSLRVSTRPQIVDLERENSIARANHDGVAVLHRDDWDDIECDPLSCLSIACCQAQHAAVVEIG
jgi:hypothetical protein